MLEGYLSGTGRNNSIDAMQQGEPRPAEDPAGASAAPATFRSSPGMHAGHRMPAGAHALHHHQHQNFAAGPGMHLERSASAGSKSERGHRSGQRRGWPDGPGDYHIAHDAHPGSRARNTGTGRIAAQHSGVAGERPLRQLGSYGTTDEPQLAEAQGQLPPPPPVFMAPARPASLPLFGHPAAPHPGLLNVQRLLRVLDNNGDLMRHHGAATGPQLPPFQLQPGTAVASQGPPVQLEPLLRQLSQHLSTSWQSRSEPADMDHAGSVRLGGDQGDNMGVEQGGGSNSAAEQYLSGESCEPAARPRVSAGARAAPSQQQDPGAGYALQTAGSLQRPAEGQLVDPHLQEERWPRRQASAQEATLGPAASWGFARSVQQAAAAEQSVQEANSLPAQAHHGHAAAGPRSGALPALSIIQGQLEPFHPGAGGPRSEGRSGPHDSNAPMSMQLQAQLENVASAGHEDTHALAAQNSMMLPRQGVGPWHGHGDMTCHRLHSRDVCRNLCNVMCASVL